MPPTDVDAAIAALVAGEIIVVPTDTVYGVAALPTVAGATAALFAAKGRTEGVPIAVLCASATQAFALARPQDATGPARRLADEHWPGALTIVLPRRHDLGWELGEPSDTIGVRCPRHDLIEALATAVGPIATTSANRHGEQTPARAADAARSLLIEPALVIDGGTLGGVASTVIRVTDGRIDVLRAGAVEIVSEP